MRCIDADELIKTYEKETGYSWNAKGILECPKCFIDNAPTVEPETKVVANVIFNKEQVDELVEKAKADILAQIERPHGQWKYIVEEDNDVECPFCGFQEDGIYYNFCPSCGADLRGKE